MPEPSPSSSDRLSRRPGGWLRWADETAGVVVSTSVAALGIMFADRLLRPDWDFSWANHWKAAPVLYLAPSAVLGLIWASIAVLREKLSHRLRFSPRRRDWVRAATLGGMATIAAIPASITTFSGARVSQTWLAKVGPPVFLLVVLLGVSTCTLLAWRAHRAAASGRRRSALILSTTFFASACGALWIDMHVYVGLYDHLHALLEFSAFGLFIGAFQLAGFVVVLTVPRVVWFNRVLASLLLVLGLTFVSYRPLRTWTDARLAHAWVDEYFVGRALRRTQILELQITGGESLRVARLDHLVRRFELKDRTLDPRYLETYHLGSAPEGVRNIVFFYVDTLRADVATDPELMPALNEFRRGALDFRRAYSTGSDTLRALPTITRGNYFIDKNHDGDLLRLAKKAGAHRHLIASESAHSYLEKLLPTFEFDEVETVVDHTPKREVWGYGAHQATAQGVGDRTVAFLESPRAQEPFLLWAFHFDIHAWREIDESYITENRERLGIAKDAPLNVRYRVIARTMDEQFERLLAALTAAGREKDTAIVFVSDHGEGLGQGGFWVHSIFLWESLIRVPLVIRLPGVKPKTVDEPVSLVDVAPTLAATYGAKSAVYHGEDLVGIADGAPRRLPLLLRAGAFHGHQRAGVLDPELKRKLVVRLEAAFPELHAYETDILDKTNLVEKEQKTMRSLLQMLVRSPVFPRGETEFKLHSKPAELAVTGAD